MKKYIYVLFLNLVIIKNTLADDAGIFGGKGRKTPYGEDIATKLRDGSITTDDIPKLLSNTTDYLMGFAGTIAIIFIIIGAYKIALGSLEGDKSKGRETILLALGGFVLAALSWVILKIIIDNFV